MTRSLIRLDNTVRASLNNDCMTNSHDECQWDDNDDAMTKTDSDITRGYRGYNAGTRDYDSITRSYKRWGKRDWTIGLDWLLGVLLIGWRGLGRMAVGLVSSAWPSPHLSPHSPLPQSFSTPPSTSI